jgi:hypothetical protein
MMIDWVTPVGGAAAHSLEAVRVPALPGRAGGLRLDRRLTGAGRGLVALIG